MWEAIEAYLFLKISNEVQDYIRPVRFLHVVASKELDRLEVFTLPVPLPCKRRRERSTTVM